MNDRASALVVRSLGNDTCEGEAMVPSRSMARGAESAQVLGRYEVLEEIASGGMATVHLGRALGESARAPHFIAVKRMHGQYARDPDFRTMFLDEARLCARIQHENVVPTLDVVDSGGELLLILELVEGESLSRLAKQASARGRRIPLGVATAITIDMLRGLHAAHEAVSETGEPLQMVHRDVSPHNVLVGSDGVSRVLDFGVAKARGRMQQTQQGQIKGKIAYMSPEQARGKAVDRRSDVFAAGIVLWELFTGKRLFEGENEATVLTQLLTETPPLLSTVDASLEPYDAILKKALTTSPDERFPSALEMATILGDAVAVAPRSEVANWVRTEARVMLAKRADLIAKHVAFASRSELDDTPRHELDEPSSDLGSGATVGAPGESRVEHPGRASHEPSLPDSAFRTQKLTPEMLAEFRSPGPPGGAFDGDAAFRRTGGASGRPSDAPPLQSRVTALSLASADLPPPLPEERVRQLFWVGIITAGSVALVVGALLVIVSKRPWSAAATSPRVVPASGDLLGRATGIHRLSPPTATTSDRAPSSPSPPTSATPSPSAGVSASASPSPKPAPTPSTSETSANDKTGSSKGPNPSKAVSSSTPKPTPPSKSPGKGR